MNNIIGNRIKEAMNLKKFKQADIVKKTGITKGALSSYINGKYEPKQTNIYKLAEALNVNAYWLMGYDIPMDYDSETENKKIQFSITLYELMRYYRITDSELSIKINVETKIIDDWLSQRELPDSEQLKKICILFNIDDEKNLFNGDLFFETIKNYYKTLDDPNSKYTFGIMLEEMLNNICGELKISSSELKSYFLNRQKDLDLYVTYDDLYVFLKKYFENKISKN